MDHWYTIQLQAPLHWMASPAGRAYIQALDVYPPSPTMKFSSFYLLRCQTSDELLVSMMAFRCDASEFVTRYNHVHVHVAARRGRERGQLPWDLCFSRCRERARDRAGETGEDLLNPRCLRPVFELDVRMFTSTRAVCPFPPALCMMNSSFSENHRHLFYVTSFCGAFFDCFRGHTCTCTGRVQMLAVCE
jgi:hypothetical protein